MCVCVCVCTSASVGRRMLEEKVPDGAIEAKRARSWRRAACSCSNRPENGG